MITELATRRTERTAAIRTMYPIRYVQVPRFLPKVYPHCEPSRAGVYPDHEQGEDWNLPKTTQQGFSGCASDLAGGFKEMD